MNHRHAAPRAALNTYAATVGKGEKKEPRDWQARDLIVDLLLMFTPETAAQILRNVEADLEAEQSTATPVYVGL